MGLQRVWHDWATELNWTELKGIKQQETWGKFGCEFEVPMGLQVEPIGNGFVGLELEREA